MALDNTRIEKDTAYLLKEGHSEQEVLAYFDAYIENYVLAQDPIYKMEIEEFPRVAATEPDIFTRTRLTQPAEDLSGWNRQPFVAPFTMNPLESGIKSTGATLLGSIVGKGLQGLTQTPFGGELGAEITAARMGRQPEFERRDLITDIENSWRESLEETPAGSTVESAFRGGAAIAGIVPDFAVMHAMTAPLKSLQGLQYLKKFPRATQFFVDSQRSALAFAGVEAQHGPAAAKDGYLAGMAFHLASLPSSKAAKAATLGLTGRWVAMLQGADRDEANAQGLLFMALPLIGMGRSRDAKRLLREAKVPEATIVKIEQEISSTAKGWLPPEAADFVLETASGSHFRRSMDRLHQDIGAKVEGRQPRYFEDLVRDLERPGVEVTEQIGAGPRRPKPAISAIQAAERRLKEGHPKKPRIGTPEVVDLTVPKFVDLSHPRVADFDTALSEGRPKEAQVIYDDVLDKVNRDPENQSLVDAERHMSKALKQQAVTESGTLDGNKYLHAQDRESFNKRRRELSVLQKKLGWGDEQYRDFLHEKYKVRSSKNLTGPQIGAVITDMRKMSGIGKASTKRPESGKVGNKTILTHEQEQTINRRMDKLRREGMTDQDSTNVYNTAGLEPDHKVGFRTTKDFTSKAEASKLSSALHVYEESIAPVRKREIAARANPLVVDAYTKTLATMNKLRGGKAPSSWLSARHFFGRAEEMTGGQLPFLSIYDGIITARNRIGRDATDHYKRLSEAAGPNGADIMADILVSADRQTMLSDYIASKSSYKNKPEAPKNMSPAETAIGNELIKIFHEYEWKVRARKFLRWKHEGEKIPEYSKFKDQIDYAESVYEAEGIDALFNVLKDQSWGVVESGYEPWAIVHDRVRLHQLKVTGQDLGHIKPRGWEYQPQDKLLFQRFNRYVQQMDSGVYLTSQIRAMTDLYAIARSQGFFPPKVKKGRLIEHQVKNDIEVFLKEIKGYNFTEGPIERMLQATYAQAMNSVIKANPAVAFRNLFQNLGFYPDRTELFDPRNKPLTDTDMNYFDTHISQDMGMDSWMLSDKAFLNKVPVLGRLNKLTNKFRMYPFSDKTNRLWAFWAKKNAVMRAVEGDKPVEQMLKAAKFTDMSTTQQKRALEVLALEGKEPFARYTAKSLVEDIHFMYDRAQRSPAEIYPGVARVGLNLFLFPRAYVEKVARSANKVRRHGWNSTEGRRGLKNLMSMTLAAALVGEGYMKVTGRLENPYNPLSIIAYEFGGLSVESIKQPTVLFGDILAAVNPNTPEDLRSMHLGRAISEVPRLADMYIPYYILMMNSLESITGTTNVDRKALRQLRAVLDSEYDIRKDAYNIDRNAYEAWQHAFFGAGIDRRIRAEEAARKTSRTRKRRRTR